MENVRSGQVTKTQKDIIVNFIKSHQDLQTGKFSPSFTKTHAQKLWEELTLMLNAVPAAPQKTWTQWRKTWQDLKKNAKAKNRLIRQHAMGTGGGAVCSTKMSETEQDIVQNLIVSTVIEGNNAITESSVVFQLDEQEQPLPQLQDHDHGSANEVTNEVIEIETFELQRSVETPKCTTPKCTYNEEINKGSTSSSFQKRTRETEEKSSRMTKTKRLEKSLTLTKELLTVSKEKKENVDNYYKEKLKFMKMKMEEKKNYHEKKLLILKERNTIESNILLTLKNIEKKL